MSLHLVLAVTIVVAIAFYVSIFNPTTIDFKLAENISYKIPLVVIVLASIFIGSLLVAFMDAIRASRQGISMLHASARYRKSRRLHLPYEKGLHFLTTGYPDKAEEEFAKVLEKDPQHVSSLIELGKIKSTKGDHQEALKFHNRAHTLEGNNLDAAFCLAEDYAVMGRYQKAQSILTNTRKTATDELVVLTKIREMSMKGELWGEARKVQGEIIHLTRDKDQLEAEKAFLNGIHYELGRDALKKGLYNEALKEFKTILKTDRGFIPAHLGAGEAYLSIGRDSDALRAWEEGYQATSSPPLLKAQEEMFLNKEDPGSAIALYKTALEGKPEALVVNYMLGKVYLKLEMMEEALEEFLKVKTAEATVPGMRKLMGDIYEKTGSQEFATQEYRSELADMETTLPLYKCDSCQASGPQWEGRCPECNEWNTYSVNIEKAEPQGEKVVQPPAQAL